VSGNVPFWELLVHTPAVFVRVANKGVAGYGTWKRIRKMGDKGRKEVEKVKEIKEAEWKGRMTLDLRDWRGCGR